MFSLFRYIAGWQTLSSWTDADSECLSERGKSLSGLTWEKYGTITLKCRIHTVICSAFQEYWTMTDAKATALISVFASERALKS